MAPRLLARTKLAARVSPVLPSVRQLAGTRASLVLLSALLVPAVQALWARPVVTLALAAVSQAAFARIPQ